MKIMVKKPKVKFKTPKINLAKLLLSTKTIYALFILVSLVALSYLGWFIYTNFYQTITQAEEIVLLKQEVAPDIIDIDDVNEVINKINGRSAKENINQNLKNPFVLASTPPPPEPEPSSEESPAQQQE